MDSYKNKMWFLINRNKQYLISLVGIAILLQLIGWHIYDAATHWKPIIDTNDSVNYDNLRKYLSSGHTFFFFTDQSLWFYGISFSLAIWLWKYKSYRTVLFCSTVYLIFNLFAMLKYRWETINIERYGSYKTITSHLAIPVFAFAFFIWIKKDIVLNIKTMMICSLFLTTFYLATFIVYYSVTFIEDGVTKNLTIYEFLDFNNKVMCFPTDKMSLRIFFNTVLILLTPVAGMVIFFVFIIIYRMKFERVWFTKTQELYLNY